MVRIFSINVNLIKMHFFQATDGDIGINSAFFYSILSGNSDKSFTINPVSGALSTTAPLDREKHDSYILLVRVSDLHGNYSYGLVFDDTTVVQVIVKVSLVILYANNNNNNFSKSEFILSVLRHYSFAVTPSNNKTFRARRLFIYDRF